MSYQQGFRAFTLAKDGSKCLAMEYGGEQSLNDMIEKRREDGLKAFPAANIEKVALHVARGLQVIATTSRCRNFSETELDVLEHWV